MTSPRLLQASKSARTESEVRARRSASPVRQTEGERPPVLAVLKSLETSMAAALASDARRAGPAALIPLWLEEIRAALPMES
jgi:hypothetical protein